MADEFEQRVIDAANTADLAAMELRDGHYTLPRPSKERLHAAIKALFHAKDRDAAPTPQALAAAFDDGVELAPLDLRRPGEPTARELLAALRLREAHLALPEEGTGWSIEPAFHPYDEPTRVENDDELLSELGLIDRPNG